MRYFTSSCFLTLRRTLSPSAGRAFAAPALVFPWGRGETTPLALNPTIVKRPRVGLRHLCFTRRLKSDCPPRRPVRSSSLNGYEHHAVLADIAAGSPQPCGLRRTGWTDVTAFASPHPRGGQSVLQTDAGRSRWSLVAPRWGADAGRDASGMRGYLELLTASASGEFGFGAQQSGVNVRLFKRLFDGIVNG